MGWPPLLFCSLGTGRVQGVPSGEFQGFRSSWKPWLNPDLLTPGLPAALSAPPSCSLPFPAQRPPRITPSLSLSLLGPQANVPQIPFSSSSQPKQTIPNCVCINNIIPNCCGALRCSDGGGRHVGGSVAQVPDHLAQRPCGHPCAFAIPFHSSVPAVF